MHPAAGPRIPLGEKGNSRCAFGVASDIGGTRFPANSPISPRHYCVEALLVSSSDPVARHAAIGSMARRIPDESRRPWTLSGRTEYTVC
ncbi:hypothetical protein SCA03_16030 [Streptomyces cacaoi]|uniref:Uncharacterized protein n=1 Tax=Streptomyces cacaoi TaxID=1898 RepID=A0A4Y3QV16_STRCI|nr:hypothetical protein SCA03_16030 [Streptomyces cacaoi]